MPPLRVGYVPEHFLTPLLLAHKHRLISTAVELIPQPSGTGQMIQSFKEGSVDVCIGLTEGWINGLGANKGLYSLVGTYVTSPLCWAISTGLDAPVHSVNDLRGSKIGVSRIGSGSYVMAYVLADQRGWTEPFEFVKLDTFANLRKGVNSGEAAAFMWERFTTKKYYDPPHREVRQIGEIYTPWPAWVVTAHKDAPREGVRALLDGLDKGIAHYHTNKDEALDYIAQNLDYSREDAAAWSETVTYPEKVSGVAHSMVDDTIATLRKAGLLNDVEIQASDIVEDV
ncbi:hypothetical protein PYCC9005_001306 [Savitreella phatthalungensis]